jgi:hypothetical protein
LCHFRRHSTCSYGWVHWYCFADLHWFLFPIFLFRIFHKCFKRGDMYGGSRLGSSILITGKFWLNGEVINWVRDPTASSTFLQPGKCNSNPVPSILSPWQAYGGLFLHHETVFRFSSSMCSITTDKWSDFKTPSKILGNVKYFQASFSLSYHLRQVMLTYDSTTFKLIYIFCCNNLGICLLKNVLYTIWLSSSLYWYIRRMIEWSNIVFAIFV